MPTKKRFFCDWPASILLTLSNMVIDNLPSTTGLPLWHLLFLTRTREFSHSKMLSKVLKCYNFDLCLNIKLEPYLGLKIWCPLQNQKLKILLFMLPIIPYYLSPACPTHDCSEAVLYSHILGGIMTCLGLEIHFHVFTSFPMVTSYTTVKHNKE